MAAAAVAPGYRHARTQSDHPITVERFWPVMARQADQPPAAAGGRLAAHVPAARELEDVAGDGRAARDSVVPVVDVDLGSAENARPCRARRCSSAAGVVSAPMVPRRPLRPRRRRFRLERRQVDDVRRRLQALISVDDVDSAPLTMVSGFAAAARSRPATSTTWVNCSSAMAPRVTRLEGREDLLGRWRTGAPIADHGVGDRRGRRGRWWPRPAAPTPVVPVGDQRMWHPTGAGPWSR